MFWNWQLEFGHVAKYRFGPQSLQRSDKGPKLNFWTKIALKIMFMVKISKNGANKCLSEQKIGITNSNLFLKVPTFVFRAISAANFEIIKTR